MMAKIKCDFDTNSSQFTVVPPDNAWSKILGTIGFTFLTFGLAILMVMGYDAYHESPTELKLRKEIAEMEVNYENLDLQLNSLHGVLTAIEKRDDNIYRMVLGAEPIDASVRKGGVGGAERYQEIREKRLAHTGQMVQLLSNVDRLRRKIYIESVSQDELLRLAGEKKKQYASIPAIQPISNRHLTALTSGFGLRVHPFHKVVAMHTGIDFAAPEGAPVYATADGVIVATDTAVYGYGNIITIDHGYGYLTRYAHLKGFGVRPGKHVKRGEKIAFVGDTGLSTAPHLHYEVMFQGVQINPVNYFFKDLNPNEYEKITQLASIPNQTMGN